MYRRIQKAAQPFFGPRGYLVRGTSIAFVLFLLLASGRALVPGMCATQSALLRATQDGHPVSTASWRAKTCCSLMSLGEAHEAPVAPTSGAPVCAFCNLAHAILDEPVPVIGLPLVEQYDDAVLAVESVLLSRDADPALRGRAPPISFA